MCGMPADGFGFARQIGEIDMCRDVSASRIIKRFFCCLMFMKGAQSTAGAVRVEIFGRCEAVIDEDQHPIDDAARNLFEKP